MPKAENNTPAINVNIVVNGIVQLGNNNAIRLHGAKVGGADIEAMQTQLSSVIEQLSEERKRNFQLLELVERLTNQIKRLQNAQK
jgi:hypothetical protein